MRWTLDDIREKGLRVIDTRSKKIPVKIKIVKREPGAIRHFKEVLQRLKIEFETEYKFIETRKYRFDIAIPEKKIAAEYEGLVSSKSRHTTLTGYSNDCSKYNLAQKNGWVVLRYTVMNYLNFENDILEILK